MPLHCLNRLTLLLGLGHFSGMEEVGFQQRLSILHGGDVPDGTFVQEGSHQAAGGGEFLRRKGLLGQQSAQTASLSAVAGGIGGKDVVVPALHQQPAADLRGGCLQLVDQEDAPPAVDQPGQAEQLLVAVLPAPDDIEAEEGELVAEGQGGNKLPALLGGLEQLQRANLTASGLRLSARVFTEKR